MSAVLSTCIDPKAQESKVIEKYKNTKGAVIPVLHEAQDIWISACTGSEKDIGGLGYLLLKYMELLLFTPNLRLTEGNTISANGTACYVKGSEQI